MMPATGCCRYSPRMWITPFRATMSARRMGLVLASTRRPGEEEAEAEVEVEVEATGCWRS